MKKYVKKPALLIILDGFGFRKERKYNAVSQANTPNIDKWLKEYPSAVIQASGNAIGMPKGYIGNSETGHLTIGTGRIIKHPLTIFNELLKTKKFLKQTVLSNDLERLKRNGGRLHIMGLLSDAGVHSHINHFFAYLKAAKKKGIKTVYLHIFLDGRDTPPRSAAKYISSLERFMKKINYGAIASIHGRFYAMDRDGNWDRIESSYKVLTSKQNAYAQNWREVLKKEYRSNITDEFIMPVQMDSDGIIKSKDGIIFVNFRPDRARELTASFVDPDFSKFKTKRIQLSFFFTTVEYSKELKTDFLIPDKPIKNTLMDVLLKKNKSVFSISETEKYAPITYFFNAGREKLYANEKRILVKSIPSKNYVKNPEMSAGIITEKVLNSLKSSPSDFYLINYANADMVGHSGNFKATIKAIEFLDQELKKLYDQVVLKMGGVIYLTADHGNAEQMHGKFLTSHTNNPVIFLMMKKDLKNKLVLLPLKKLSDIAPFILKNFNIAIPKEMND